MLKIAALTCVLPMCVQAADEKPVEKLESGPRVGSLPQAFYVRDVTGRFARGPKVCYRCTYGIRPVVGVFVKKLDKPVIDLLKAIDQRVVEHSRAEENPARQLAAFCVLYTDNPDAAEAQLKRVQKEHKLRKLPLTVFDGESGPRSYRLNRDAAVTVSMWAKSDVKSNHAFRAATKLNRAAVKKVVAATSKIAPAPKAQGAEPGTAGDGRADGK